MMCITEREHFEGVRGDLDPIYKIKGRIECTVNKVTMLLGTDLLAHTTS